AVDEIVADRHPEDIVSRPLDRNALRLLPDDHRQLTFEVDIRCVVRENDVLPIRDQTARELRENPWIVRGDRPASGIQDHAFRAFDVHAMAGVIQAYRDHLGGLARNQKPDLRDRKLASRPFWIPEEAAGELLDLITLPDSIRYGAFVLETNIL